MIIFLYGPDDYRREEKKRKIVEEFKTKNSNLGLGYFDLVDDDEFLNFSDFIKSQSMFSSKKLAVLRGVFDVPKEKVIPLLKSILEEKAITVLVAEGGKVLKDFKFLEKEPVLSQEFEVLKGEEWEGFVVNEIKKRGIKVSLNGIKFLAQVYEGDTWRFITELDKIQHLGNPSTSSGPRMEIHTRDLEDLGIEQVPNFWSLIWGFKNREIKERLWALEKVFGMNESAAKMFNILAYQLPEKLNDLADYDLMVKSGKLEYEEALLELVISQ